MLQVAKRKVLRLIKGVTRRDKLRNSRIRAELGVTPLLEEIERNKMRWYGHVKKNLTRRPQIKRPVGRPRKRWLDGAKEVIEKRGSSIEHVEELLLYEDREVWRTFLKVCQLTDD